MVRLGLLAQLERHGSGNGGQLQTASFDLYPSLLHRYQACVVLRSGRIVEVVLEQRQQGGIFKTCLTKELEMPMNLEATTLICSGGQAVSRFGHDPRHRPDLREAGGAGLRRSGVRSH
jgi:hypothetical protein